MEWIKKCFKNEKFIMSKEYGRDKKFYVVLNFMYRIVIIYSVENWAKNSKKIKMNKKVQSYKKLKDIKLLF